MQQASIIERKKYLFLSYFASGLVFILSTLLLNDLHIFSFML